MFTILQKRIYLFVFVLTIISCSQNHSNYTVIEPVQIHNQSIVIDAHADIVTAATSPTFLSADGLSQVHLSKLKTGRVDAVVMSVAVNPGPRSNKAEAEARSTANYELNTVLDLIKENADSVVLALSPTDIISAEKEGKTAIILGFQNARSLQKNVFAIDSFFNIGIRVFALNHLGHNAFSDSSRPLYDGESKTYESEEEHGGLSALGKQAIQRINALGGIVDVSQSSKASTLQAIELSASPVIASHSNVRAISDVNRNLSDQEIDKIGATGGVIHVSAFRAYLLELSNPDLITRIKHARRTAGVEEDYDYPFELYWEIENLTERMSFLKSISDILGPATVENMVDHIDYIVSRIGIEHVGIGTDFNHGSRLDGFSDASEAFNVTKALIERGYSAAEIGKIWGGNFLRVFAQAVENTK